MLENIIMAGVDMYDNWVEPPDNASERNKDEKMIPYLKCLSTSLASSSTSSMIYSLPSSIVSSLSSTFGSSPVLLVLLEEGVGGVFGQ
jgi:hypothetical protein